MKHYVTDLDGWLLLSDEEVRGWSDEFLVARTSMIVLMWQWLTKNNEVMEDMEMGGWEELEGKAEDSEWFADDVKKGGWGKRDGHRAGKGGKEE